MNLIQQMGIECSLRKMTQEQRRAYERERYYKRKEQILARKRELYRLRKEQQCQQ